ncbi:hypothetical protein [Streptomyces milbemycinicus]|uniref:hypothetical protein n=1 Tax=Streptomyces milbemycinicus TaxID=476552 RepID=UPI0033D5EEE6
MNPVLPDYLTDHAADLAALQRQVAHDRWLAATGQDNGTDAAALNRYERFRHVTDGHLFHAALDRGDVAFAQELALWYFRTNLAAPTLSLRQAQRATTAPWRGSELSHSQLLAAHRVADSPQDREMLGQALAAVSAQLGEHRLRWLDAYAGARQRLGFPTHGHLVRALHPDVDLWVADARSWLAKTREDFLRRWRDWQRIDGLAEPRLLDTRLVAERAGSAGLTGDLMAAVVDTVASWGMSGALRRVTIDTTARAGKLSFSFCSPVDPPRDVRVSVGTGRSLRDLPVLLHEFGHALHFTVGVNGPADLWRTSPALTEGFGFAIEQIAHQPSWHRRFLGREVPQEALARLRFSREAVQRLVAAGLCYEMAVHDGCPDPEGEYTRVFSAEFEVAAPGAEAFSRMQAYLEGQPCYPLVYHQAFRLRAPLWEFLCQRGGGEWYSTTHANGALQGLFRQLGATTLEDWTTELPTS